jgi:hypothetical protein
MMDPVSGVTADLGDPAKDSRGRRQFPPHPVPGCEAATGERTPAVEVVVAAVVGVVAAPVVGTVVGAVVVVDTSLEGVIDTS